MWYTLRRSPKADPDFVSSATELLQSTSRNLILLVGSAALVLQLVPAFSRPATLIPKAVPPMFVLIATCALALWVLPKHHLAAQIVWQLGLAIAVSLAVYTFQQPVIALSYSLLPLMAVVTAGWKAGLLSEIMVIGLSSGLSYSTVVPSLTGQYSLAIIAGGAFAGLIGWAATHALLTVTQWAVSSYEQARRTIEEARQQRMELKQIQEDLIHANQELARLSDRLRSMYQIAEEARQAKQEFVTNVSHELRTPLNMVVGYSEMMLRAPEMYGGSIPPMLLADLAVIHRNAAHLSDLIDDVLDLSQIEAGQMALTKEYVEIRELVETAAIAVRPLLDSKGLYLETELPEELPSISCDRTRIREVLLNLLSNAGRFTEQGGVRVRAWQEGNDLVMSIVDTGPGIAVKDVNKLFQPFQQLDGSIRRRYDGSGLGLSISKAFIELHGGKIWVESEEGIGTAFFFRLPLEPPVPVGPEFQRGLRPGWEFHQRTRPSAAPRPTVVPRFVVLETGDALQRLLTRYLDDVEIVRVSSPEEAIRELADSPSHGLLVNDISVESALRRLEAVGFPYSTPAMICSVPGPCELAADLGVCDYLVKPISRDVLLEALEHLELPGKTVLVVDDEPDTLRLFRRMLTSSRSGYRVLRARDGQEAMNILHTRRPDVVLLDLVMPTMNGFQLLEAKSEDPELRDIPVIVISARDPAGQPIVTNAIAVTREGGLSVRHLLDYIRMLKEVFSTSQ